MEHRLREADKRSAGQNNSHLLWKPSFVLVGTTLKTNASNPHSHTIFYKIHFNGHPTYAYAL